MKNMRLYGKYYSALTGEKERVYKPHEAKSLEVLVDECLSRNCEIKDFDNFYYGYIIPQIGKEFDILKIGENAVLNIELKSYVADLSLVQEQLIKNRFYLAHIDKPQYFFTFNSYDKKVYRLTSNNKLTPSSLEEVIKVNNNISAPISALIDDLFAVSQFVLSPTEHPEKFINKEYFLTQQQQQIKKSVLENINDNHIIKIAGGPGTGKTLLLYELAVNLAKNSKVCFLQPGAILQSQKLIQNAFSNLTFIQLEESIPNLHDYDYILSDESERYPLSTYNQLIYLLKQSKQKCILTFEKSDIPIVGERLQSSIRMAKIRGNLYTLSGKVRINNQINKFICALFDNNSNTFIKDLKGVEIYQSTSKKESTRLVNYLNQKGYKNILSTKNACHKCDKERDSIPLNIAYGKEYDNVTVVINNDFFYNNKGILSQKQTNAFADDLYCAVTRVRKNLCLIIENNLPILERALNLKK